MEKDYAIFNLTEAKDAIEQLLSEMQSDADYDIGNYQVDMQHIYWHINSAWNGKGFNMTSDTLTDALYESFIQYPTDLTL